MLSKVIAQANVDHVEKWFDRAEKLVIVSHVSPDGDAIGSSLGLYHFLVSQEKTVHIIVPNRGQSEYHPKQRDLCGRVTQFSCLSAQSTFLSAAASGFPKDS